MTQYQGTMTANVKTAMAEPINSLIGDYNGSRNF